MRAIFGTILLAGDDVVSFVPALIIVALAVVVPLLLGQFRSKLAVPVVVGEIMLGIAAGILYPELKDDQLLKILREIGFGFLFFLAGTEIDLRSMFGGGSSSQNRSILAQPLPLGLLSWTLTVAIGMALTFLLWQMGFLTSKNWYFMAITLSPTSLGIVVSLLKDSGYIRKKLGQIVLVAATIADFGAVIVLAVLAPILKDGFTSDVLLLGLVFVAFFVAWLVLGTLYNRRGIRNNLSMIQTPTAPVKMRIAFLIFIGFVALAQVVGAKIVLGTFMGGILLGLLMHHEDHDLLHQLEGVGYGFFIPIFFIMVGVRFDVNALMAEWQNALLLVPLLFVVAVLNKVIPGLLFRKLFGWRDTLAGGILLTSRISLMVAAAEIGKDVGVFTSAEEAAVILLATIMATMGPLIFNRMMPSPEAEAPPPIVVTNAGRFGLELAGQFQRHEESVVLIDPDPEHIERAHSMGFEAILGSVEHPNETVQAILEKTEKFVTTYLDTEVNYAIAQVAKRRFGIPHVVTEVTNLQDIPRFESLDVTAVNPTLDRYTLLGLVTRNPTSYNILTRTDDGQEVHEFLVRNHFLAGKRLRDVKLPAGMLLLAVQRSGELLVPNADTELKLGDRVTIAGELGHVNEMFAMFSTDSSVRVK